MVDFPCKRPDLPARWILLRCESMTERDRSGGIVVGEVKVRTDLEQRSDKLSSGGQCWIRTNLAGFWLGAILRKSLLTRQITAQRYLLLSASFQRVTACRRPGS